MTTILIGTSGYSYKDWVGPFYPPGTKPSNFLAYYQREFNFTELNFSYYRQPDPAALDRMVKSTGEHFQFAIKATKGITHDGPAGCEKEAEQFIENIKPLVNSKKLAAVLLQFPFSFHYTTASRRQLASICQLFEGLPLAVEFRNREWQKESVYAGLKSFHACFTNVDLPALKGLPVAKSVVTAPLSYVRFHGRNIETWWSGNNTTRYDYLYNDQELREWVPHIRSMMESSRKVIIAFNNHWNAQAIKNAKSMAGMLDLG